MPEEMPEEMISKAEAQDVINAVVKQRDDALNREAQLIATLAKAQRELELLRANYNSEIEKK